MRSSVVFLFVSVSLGLTFATSCKDPCTTADGEKGYCFEKQCINHVDDETKQNLTFSITVKYPKAQLETHGGTSLYIRGNGLDLLWIKGKQLSQTEHDTWMVNITYKSSPGGFQCQECSDKSFVPGNKLQYRIFVDDREDMLGANFAIKLPVSKTSPYFDVKPNFVSYPWFYVRSGTIQNFEIQSKYIGGSRNITIYTPPSFEENTYKTYPAIIGFDLSVDITTFSKRNIDGPILPHAVAEEYVIVGFGDYKNSGVERTDLLTPTVGPFYECVNGTFGDNCGGCIPVDPTDNPTEFMRYLKNDCGKLSVVGGRGDDTLDFLIYEALPFAKQHLSARLKTDDLGVIGYSLGGLMSCYAAWTRPHVFSFAACQSPSFWWPSNNISMDAVDFDFLNKTLKDPAFQGSRTHQRLYLDAGGMENLDPYRLTQAVVETGEMLNSFNSFKLNENLWVAVDPGKNHSMIEWARRVRQALAALLPAAGDPRMPVLQAAMVG